MKTGSFNSSREAVGMEEASSREEARRAASFREADTQADNSQEADSLVGEEAMMALRKDRLRSQPRRKHTEQQHLQWIPGQSGGAATATLIFGSIMAGAFGFIRPISGGPLSLAGATGGMAGRIMGPTCGESVPSVVFNNMKGVQFT